MPALSRNARSSRDNLPTSLLARFSPLPSQPRSPHRTSWGHASLATYLDCCIAVSVTGDRKKMRSDSLTSSFLTVGHVMATFTKDRRIDMEKLFRLRSSFWSFGREGSSSTRLSTSGSLIWLSCKLQGDKGPIHQWWRWALGSPRWWVTDSLMK